MKSLFIALAISLSPAVHKDQKERFDDFTKKFVKEYKALHIPDLELPYVDDIRDIKSTDSVEKETGFFTEIKKEIGGFKQESLNPSQQEDELQIRFETGMNLQRLALEKQWLANRPNNISTKGISTLPNGKDWYIYLLKRWLTDDVTPDQIYKFGMQEIKDVQEHIEQIRQQTGLSEDAFYKHLDDPQFFNKDPIAIQHLFEQAKDTVYRNLDRVFYHHNIPLLNIKRGEARMLAQTPGYYESNTFYYNLFDKPYNTRAVDWLFIHEAVPGHHYQISIDASQKYSKVHDLFSYPCYAEGWACYTEDLGKQIGLYKTPYAELGKWEWDIVRAVRIPMDIGLNYYGWTDEQALAFWKKNIRNQDDIAMREIARVKRWPVQAISYNYGAMRIKQLKLALMKKEGDKFNIKDFHERVLHSGFLPWFMVERNVLKG